MSLWVIRALFLLLLAGLSGLGCTHEPAAMPEPDYGRTACEACKAPIEDPRFAAQYQLADGTVKSFDDPICLFTALRADGAAPTAVRFRARDGERWLSGTEVWLAHTPSTESPHDSGWAAYPNFGAAQDAVTAAGSGEILQFDAARAKLGGS